MGIFSCVLAAARQQQEWSTEHTSPRTKDERGCRAVSSCLEKGVKAEEALPAVCCRW
jgi:hypothetical protein